MLLMRGGMLLLAALLGTGCTSGNPRYDGGKAHHRPAGFVNSDPTVNVGNIPMHEVLLRRLRGDFKPQQEPDGGYAAFTRAWTLPIFKVPPTGTAFLCSLRAKNRPFSANASSIPLIHFSGSISFHPDFGSSILYSLLLSPATFAFSSIHVSQKR